MSSLLTRNRLFAKGNVLQYPRSLHIASLSSKITAVDCASSEIITGITKMGPLQKVTEGDLPGNGYVAGCNGARAREKTFSSPCHLYSSYFNLVSFFFSFFKQITRTKFSSNVAPIPRLLKTSSVALKFSSFFSSTTTCTWRLSSGKLSARLHSVLSRIGRPRGASSRRLRIRAYRSSRQTGTGRGSKGRQAGREGR